jgi:hypothetical protein
LLGYDQAIAFGDTLANPMGTGIGFSNPGLMGVIGLGIREAVTALRQDAIDRIAEARLKGEINDANRRVAPGTPIGRAGGVGTPGVGGGFTQRPGNGQVSGAAGGAGKAASGSGSSGRPAERPSPARSNETRGSKFGRDSRSFGH